MLSYYNLYFELWPTQTNGGLWWRNIWDRLEEYIVACLQILRMPLGAFRMMCEKLQTTYGLQSILNISIKESVAMFLTICAHNEVQKMLDYELDEHKREWIRTFF